jgi:P-type Cu+ transporter
MASKIFVIEGMHCAACAFSNERALRKLPGVRSADVSLSTRSARVDFDDTLISEAALREAIIKNGYALADER